MLSDAETHHGMLDVAFVGHFARDRLVIAGEAQMASGGGVYYGSMAARRLGHSVAVVTRLHPDDFHYLDELRSEGIAVHAAGAPQTTGIENVYPEHTMDRRVCHPLGSAGPFSAEDLPELGARVTVITPLMAGEVSGRIVRLLASRGPIGVDVQGFARVPAGGMLITKDWSSKQSDLGAATYLKADDAEAEVLTGSTDLRESARVFAGMGPREVVLTHARGVLVYAGGRFYQAPFTPREVRGRTGRGDTTFATYVATRLRADADYACRLAAAVGSLKLEQPGPFRLTLADAEARMA
ncbi:MAG TPA: PfkB family carbohydrate kinase [bacterium]|nr:PfkB family carbohydrate kinase [bacterium]